MPYYINSIGNEGLHSYWLVVESEQNTPFQDKPSGCLANLLALFLARDSCSQLLDNLECQK